MSGLATPFAVKNKYVRTLDESGAGTRVASTRALLF